MTGWDMTQGGERAARRAEAVRALVRDRGLREITATAGELHAAGPVRPETIRLRAGYLENRTPSLLHPGSVRRRPPEHLRPPLARLLLPQGVALRFHLMALFAAQCGTRPGRAWPGGVPLGRRAAHPGTTWLDLVAVSPTGEGPMTASQYTANKLRQFRSALTVLTRHGLTELPGPGPRRRYDGFRLLAEDGRNPGAGVAEYRVPERAEDTLAVPVEFFTRGWVQVLTPSETAAYLMWLRLGGGSGYVIAGESRRAARFGLSRDVQDTARALEAFGLLSILKPDRRRTDGTWHRYDAAEPLYADRVHVLPDGPRAWAPAVVEKALRKRAALGAWAKPLDL
ncbi:hypothetical protein GCM10009757_27930 [Streptomyces cheonanensis]|uniref:Uncharacterized protein n=3 Tax=Streptomyces TaxID=1883 RepID=A0A1I6SMS0_9ACTN|nr:hypothetical protein SAMN05444716_10427 [Streptomyces harbinensis]